MEMKKATLLSDEIHRFLREKVSAFSVSLNPFKKEEMRNATHVWVTRNNPALLPVPSKDSRDDTGSRSISKWQIASNSSSSHVGFFEPVPPNFSPVPVSVQNCVTL